MSNATMTRPNGQKASTPAFPSRADQPARVQVDSSSSVKEQVSPPATEMGTREKATRRALEIIRKLAVEGEQLKVKRESAGDAKSLWYWAQLEASRRKGGVGPQEEAITRLAELQAELKDTQAHTLKCIMAGKPVDGLGERMSKLNAEIEELQDSVNRVTNARSRWNTLTSECSQAGARIENLVFSLYGIALDMGDILSKEDADKIEEARAERAKYSRAHGPRVKLTKPADQYAEDQQAKINADYVAHIDPDWVQPETPVSPADASNPAGEQPGEAQDTGEEDTEQVTGEDTAEQNN